MSKLGVALLLAGTAAVTGIVVSKISKSKKKSNTDFMDDFDDCCCECGDSLDVVIPDEEDCAEEPAENAESEDAE